ncbi:MAG TPA: HepT-like ribonuclease domain-containing protein [Anaerolineaceae bacterium]
MQTACRKIVHYTAGMSRQDFLRDDKTYDAVIRNLEIIGEAAKNVPEEIQKRYQVDG